MATESALTLLTLVLIKPLLITLIIGAGLLLLQKKSAALQHFWLAIGLFALLLLPVLFSFLPEIKWQVLPSVEHASLIVQWLHSLAVWFRHIDHLMAVVAVYFLGFFWLLFYLLLGVLGLALQTRQAVACNDPEMLHILRELSEEMDVTRDVRLVKSNAVTSPHMWGVFIPTIVLPNDINTWSSERKLSVVLHELGHVARNDWVTMLVVKVCCAVFWFWPPVWWFAQRLFHCAEIACDDYIYRLHKDYRLRNKEIVYAENLLAMAQPSAQKSEHENNPVLAMAGRSPIFYRIEAILDRQRPRENASPETRQYWVLVSIMLLLPLASLQLIPIQQSLMARVLRIQVAHLHGPDFTVNTVKESVVPVHKLNVDTLRKLKQQLRVENAPVMPLEHLFVTTPRDAVDEYALPTDKPILPDMALQPRISVQGYMPIDIVIPVYPRNALQSGTEGEVVVEFSIAEDGSILAPHIVYSRPRHVFEKSVLTALKKSRYQPQIIDGIPVILEGVVETFTFEIEQPLIAHKRRR